MISCFIWHCFFFMIIIFAYFYLICIYLCNYSASISYGLFVLIMYYKDLNVYCWFLVSLLNLYIMMHIIIECFCTNSLMYCFMFGYTVKHVLRGSFSRFIRQMTSYKRFKSYDIFYTGDHMTRFIYSSFNFLLNWITNSH